MFKAAIVYGIICGSLGWVACSAATTFWREKDAQAVCKARACVPQPPSCGVMPRNCSCANGDAFEPHACVGD